MVFPDYCLFTFEKILPCIVCIHRSGYVNVSFRVVEGNLDHVIHLPRFYMGKLRFCLRLPCQVFLHFIFFFLSIYHMFEYLLCMSPQKANGPFPLWSKRQGHFPKRVELGNSALEDWEDWGIFKSCGRKWKRKTQQDWWADFRSLPQVIFILCIETNLPV